VISIDFKNIREDNYEAFLADKLQPDLNSNHHNILAFLHKWYSGDTKFIVKTSGSTGAGPKELGFNKQQMIESARLTISYFDLREGDRALLCLPIDYIAGKMMLVRAIVGGLKLFVVDPSSDFWDELNEDMAFAAIVPLQLERAAIDKTSYIEKTLIGGAPINDRLKERFGLSKSTFYESFGMSESLSHFAIKNLSGGEEAFTLLSGVEANANEEGQLSVKVPWITSIWLKTDDKVVFKAKDKFQWLGRFSDTINSGGVKIDPYVCERKLIEPLRAFFDKDRSFYMTSFPDATLGQKVMLIIEGEEKHGLRDVLPQYLEKYEVPKDVVFIKRFKYSSSGKILKSETKALLK
jgi:O-succinylbenzoic acid--CoA ligase